MPRISLMIVLGLSLLTLTGCSSGIKALKSSDPEWLELTPQAVTTSHRVPTSASDAEENPNEPVYFTGPVLELGQKSDTVPQHTGIRFLGVNVPKDADVTKAYIEFKAATSAATQAEIIITGAAQDSAGEFGGTAPRISALPTTGSTVTWRPSSWTTGSLYTTENLAAIVEDIVSRPNWQAGAAMAFVVTGTGQRKALSYDSNADTAPRLVIEYETSSGNPEIATWLERLKTALAKEDKEHFDPIEFAKTGDLYRYGRDLNEALTSLSAAYRVTKDPSIATYIRDVLAIMKSKLTDTDNDKHKNWIYLAGRATLAECRTIESGAELCGTDKHQMDEMLTHSSVAGAAYTLQQAGFTSDAAFWVDYLKNHFEAKWNKRGNLFSTGRTHPHVQYTRFLYYMSKLTGDSSYYTQATQRASDVKAMMREVDGGYVWAHGWKETTGCQPTVYIRLTMQALADLSVVDQNLFNNTFMTKIAKTMANKVLRTANGTNLADDVCGNGTYSNTWAFSKTPYGVVAPWDSSGKIEAALRKAYAEQPNQGYYTVPTMMIHSLGR